MSIKPLISSLTKIKVGARGSPLSQVQVKEVEALLPGYTFEPTLMETTGDLDQKTSLRALDRTDFFTKEVDQRQLQGDFRISIHSAKDLPEKILEGLRVIAVTKGVDPSDSLVLREGEQLKEGMIIATSSKKREEAVRQLCANVQFADIRGTIEKRIAQMDSGKVDGVVIAEAALIRLGLTHLNRIKLPEKTTQGQGQLAIIAREDDLEMEELFAPLDVRIKSVYLGLEVPQCHIDRKYLHHPLIKIVPHEIDPIPKATHVIFTSKTAVDLLLSNHSLSGVEIIAVGKKTAKRVQKYGLKTAVIAKEECAEGIVAELEKLNLSKAKVFWPHSSLSRPILSDYLKRRGVLLEEAILYDTCTHNPGPLPAEYEELFFTSPSTVRAFHELYGELPKGKRVKAIGPITAQLF